MPNSATRSSAAKRLLWVDDDPLPLSPLLWQLRDEGYEVESAASPTEAIDLLRAKNGDFDVIVIDVVMPLSPAFQPEDAYGGRRTGVALARWIRANYPSIPVIGCTVIAESETSEWFERYAFGYISKFEILETPRRLVSLVERAVTSGRRRPKCFLIHGRDDKTLFTVKDFLQNSLGFDEPVVLRQQPSLGRTIIEKFEAAAADIDIAFALFTPDDVVVGPDGSNDEKRRARQNVIFELGYFWGKFQRKRGRVVLLYSGPLELPSDLLGIVYVDISAGIEAAGETIRRELVGWL